MRAVVRRRYGPPEVVEVAELPDPAVGPKDVVIRVRAASVNRSDWEALTGRPFYARVGGLRRPKLTVLGTDVAGVVEAVGADVERFQPGDEVLGDAMYHGVGTFAEYVQLPEAAPIVVKPQGVSFEEASALPQAAVIALQGTEGIAPNARVLVNGAGGGAGASAIQLAKAAGAHVTGVDNTTKLDLMRSLGADEVIDYTTADYTRSERGFDRILDLVCHRSLLAIRRVVAPGGTYRVVGGSVPALLQVPLLGWALRGRGRRFGVLMVKPNAGDLRRAADLVAAGTLRVPIERTFPLEEAAAALAHHGADRALGKVVLTT